MFEKDAQCIVEQINTYFVIGAEIPGAANETCVKVCTVVSFLDGERDKERGRLTQCKKGRWEGGGDRWWGGGGGGRERICGAV